MSRQQASSSTKKAKPDTGKVGKFYIPTSEADWWHLAIDANLESSSFSDLPNDCVSSSSETTDAQFITYRAIRRTIRDSISFDKFRNGFGITDEIWEISGRICAESEEMDKFLLMVQENVLTENINERDPRWPGSWVDLKRLQEQVMSKSPEQRARTHARDVLKAASAALLEQFSSGISNLPKTAGQTPGTEAKTQGQYTPSVMATDESEHPPSDDEVIVNNFICTILQDSSALFGHYLADWTIDRIGLELRKAGNSRYVAFTDGTLRPRVGDKIHAVVEAKRRIRAAVEHSVTKQEVSEIVGMVKNRHPGVFNKHWPLIAMDRHEIYVQFFRCGPHSVPAYINYLNHNEGTGQRAKKGKKTKSKPPFLVGSSFGPWDIGSVYELHHVIRIFVAITIIGNLEVATKLHPQGLQQGIHQD